MAYAGFNIDCDDSILTPTPSLYSTDLGKLKSRHSHLSPTLSGPRKTPHRNMGVKLTVWWDEKEWHILDLFWTVMF